MVEPENEWSPSLDVSAVLSDLRQALRARFSSLYFSTNSDRGHQTAANTAAVSPLQQLAEDNKIQNPATGVVVSENKPDAPGPTPVSRVSMHSVLRRRLVVTSFVDPISSGFFMFIRAVA